MTFVFGSKERDYLREIHTEKSNIWISLVKAELHKITDQCELRKINEAEPPSFVARTVLFINLFTNLVHFQIGPCVGFVQTWVAHYEMCHINKFSLLIFLENYYQ